YKRNRQHLVTDNGCEILTLRKDDTIPAIISHDE
ncbi:hypothetical protein, partial [Klebsiella pneumoniae]